MRKIIKRKNRKEEKITKNNIKIFKINILFLFVTSNLFK